MYELTVPSTTKGAPGVATEGLGKRYDDIWALRDLDLQVPAGSVLGLLGHNGAGKTTAIRILTTLALPTTGRASVAGFDVVDRPGEVRARLGLAASLVAQPPVLFLDEPTTGLDPQSRNELWDLLRELVAAGATLVLTTQYLEEADRLADDIVVLERGRVAATGSPGELKARVGGERLEVTVGAPDDLGAAVAALESFADGPSDADDLRVTIPVRAGTRLMEVARALDGAQVDVTDVHRREATLDDVFLTLTGAAAASRKAA
jgi:ABC-2 type transport system ATP-binding protein